MCARQARIVLSTRIQTADTLVTTIDGLPLGLLRDQDTLVTVQSDWNTKILAIAQLLCGALTRSPFPNRPARLRTHGEGYGLEYGLNSRLISKLLTMIT